MKIRRWNIQKNKIFWLPVTRTLKLGICTFVISRMRSLRKVLMAVKREGKLVELTVLPAEMTRLVIIANTTSLCLLGWIRWRAEWNSFRFQAGTLSASSQYSLPVCKMFLSTLESPMIKRLFLACSWWDILVKERARARSAPFIGGKGTNWVLWWD